MRNTTFLVNILYAKYPHSISLAWPTFKTCTQQEINSQWIHKTLAECFRRTEERNSGGGQCRECFSITVVYLRNKNVYIFPHLWHTNAEWWDKGRTSFSPVNFSGCWGQPHSHVHTAWSRIRQCILHLVVSGTKWGLLHLTTSLQ